MCGVMVSLYVFGCACVLCLCVVVFSGVGVGSGADSAHLSSVLVGVKRGDAAFSVGVVVS